jgi:hypothetical protein
MFRIFLVFLDFKMSIQSSQTDFHRTQDSSNTQNFFATQSTICNPQEMLNETSGDSDTISIASTISNGNF